MMNDDPILAADSWFSALAVEQRKALVGNAKNHTVSDGGYIYRIGDAPNGLHVVMAGQVRLISYPAAGQEAVNMIVKPGRWFGELSMIDGKERPHDAIAHGPTRIASVPISAIEQIGAEMPGFWRGLALLHCAHHRLGMRAAAQVQGLPAIARLAAFLSRSPDGSNIRMTQDALAQLVGISRQRLNMLLHHLVRQGLVGTGYGSITVSHSQGLADLAAYHEVGR